jgi:hypothetical protein
MPEYAAFFYTTGEKSGLVQIGQVGVLLECIGGRVCSGVFATASFAVVDNRVTVFDVYSMCDALTRASGRIRKMFRVIRRQEGRIQEAC